MVISIPKPLYIQRAATLSVVINAPHPKTKTERRRLKGNNNTKPIPSNERIMKISTVQPPSPLIRARSHQHLLWIRTIIIIIIIWCRGSAHEIPIINCAPRHYMCCCPRVGVCHIYRAGTHYSHTHSRNMFLLLCLYAMELCVLVYIYGARCKSRGVRKWLAARRVSYIYIFMKSIRHIHLSCER